MAEFIRRWKRRPNYELVFLPHFFEDFEKQIATVVGAEEMQITQLRLAITLAVLMGACEFLAMTKTVGGSVNSKREHAELVVLFEGDSERSESQELQKLAQITLSDLKSAWQEAGIEPYAWTEDPVTRAQSSDYPYLYEIQSYAAFEYECHYDEVPLLLGDSQRAMNIVHSEEAKRALSVLISVSSRQASLKRGIRFRSQLISWPPETEIVPGLPAIK